MAAISRSYHTTNGALSFCMPIWLLAFAPWLVASIVLALLLLLGIYGWRDARARRRGQPSSAEGALFIGLVILSVVAVLFFAVVALLSLVGPCVATPTPFPGEVGSYHVSGVCCAGRTRLPVEPNADACMACRSLHHQLRGSYLSGQMSLPASHSAGTIGTSIGTT